MDKESLLLDLLWVLDSEYLIRHPINFPGIKRERLRSFLINHLMIDSKINPKAFESFPDLDSGRLGRYFENLLEFIFSKSDSVRLLDKNVPIRNSVKTLGEFDFLLECEDNENIHLEVALKFYLKLKKEPSLSSYIGPNAKDRLDLKLTKLFNNQLTLSQREEGKGYLDLKYGKPFTPMLWITGFLFYPMEEYLTGDYKKSLLDEINFSHSAGFWISWEERLEIPQTKPNSYYSMPSRLSWLMNYPINSEVYTYDELIVFLKNLEDPGFSVLIIEWDRVDVIPRELSRGFLVSRKLIEAVSLMG